MMAHLSHNLEPGTLSENPSIHNGLGSIKDLGGVVLNEVRKDTSMDEELKARYEPGRMSELAAEYLAESPFGDIRGQAAGKKFVVGRIGVNDERFGRFADLGRAPETTVFTKIFNQTLTQVHNEYKPTDPRSTMIFVLHVGDDEGNPISPKPAGSIRLIEGSTEADHKSIQDLIEDSPSNPWRDELQEILFTKNGQILPYDATKAWKKLCRRAHVRIDPAKTLDVATLAVFTEYGSGGELDSVRQRLYHSCLREALMRGKRYLVSIQDEVPFQILQNIVEPFSTFEGLKPHKYPAGYTFQTIPAYCVLPEAMKRGWQINEVIAGIFINGDIIRRDTLLLQDQAPEIYGGRRRRPPIRPSAVNKLD